MEIRLPNLGEDTESGTVLSVFVQKGEAVAVDQALIELESEKAVASVPANVAGRITQIHVKEGDEIRVGAPIVSIDPDAPDDPGEQETARPEFGEPAPEEDPPPTSPTPVEPVEGTPSSPPTASPSIRRIARQLDLDLGRVRGTGRGGRIVLGDLRDYIARLEDAPQTQAETPERETPVAARPDFSRWGPVTSNRMTSIRKTIARRMVESWSQAPHVTQTGDADITRLTELRRQYGAIYKDRGARLTLTPILLKATAETLARHPLLNSSLDEHSGSIVTKGYYHMGLAVDTDAGLIVPVIRDVNQKTVFELAREIEEIGEDTRQRRVSKEQLQGGTFTVSNQGGIGGGHFTPIINLPEVAILGVGRAREVVQLSDGTPEAKLLLPLTVSHDHRVVDGANGVRFLVDLIQTIEEFPESELKLE